MEFQPSKFFMKTGIYYSKGNSMPLYNTQCPYSCTFVLKWNCSQMCIHNAVLIFFNIFVLFVISLFRWWWQTHNRNKHRHDFWWWARQDQTTRRDQANKLNCVLQIKTFRGPANAIRWWFPSKLLFHWAVKLVFKPCKSC